ncbi:F-box protein skip23 [Rhynchospora pubera]|uniref:F-box protein skip23 n=1 Tax=Rhynchospora pubera TaxID=906938 RepID=A0AAV8G2A0_9POAL|nr:F-box protein skip23 [Rhynchospora pubera]
MGPNWCLLPPELLQFIAEKAASLGDYIRFRAVCHPWRSASSPHPRNLPIQLPWLMLPFKFYGNDDTTRLFYDLSASKIHSLDLPELCGAEICGTSHGWFVLHKGQVTSLFNPITRATISLPPYTVPPSDLGIAPINVENAVTPFGDCCVNNSALCSTHDFFLEKAILTSSPMDAGCMVIVHTSSLWELAFCKIGDERWTVIQYHEEAPNEWCDICDLSYINGVLYTQNPYGFVTMYNLISPSNTGLNCEPISRNIYLVQGVDGDVLLIHYHGFVYADGILEREIEHTVYKLTNDGEPRWIKVNDVGKNVFFIGGGCQAFSLSSDHLQLSGAAKCVYYVSRWTEQNQHYLSWYNHKIKLGKLDNETVTDISGDLGSFQRNGHWEESLWLTPSLV